LEAKEFVGKWIGCASEKLEGFSEEELSMSILAVEKMLAKIPSTELGVFLAQARGRYQRLYSDKWECGARDRAREEQ
jgi:hypothetical protein